MTSIRGNSPLMNDEGKELHDCFDCKGCICEKTCAENEEKYFGKKVKKVKKKGGENDG